MKCRVGKERKATQRIDIEPARREEKTTEREREDLRARVVRGGEEDERGKEELEMKERRNRWQDRMGSEKKVMRKTVRDETKRLRR